MKKGTRKKIITITIILIFSFSFCCAEEIEPIGEIEEESITVEDESQKFITGVQETTIKATSEVLKSGIKVSWTKSKGYSVDYYEIYRSTKKDSGFGNEPYYITKSGDTKSYSDKLKQKKGKTYYYKVRGVREIDGEKIYTKFSKITYKKAPKTTKVPVESGELIVAPDSSVVKPGSLTIKTSEGSNYYVYLDSKESTKKDVAVYIKGGDTITISVPMGDFKLYYCSGQTWYGKSEKFGSATVGSVANTTLSFGINTAYTVTLYAVKNGNMGTKKVNMDNFPG